MKSNAKWRPKVMLQYVDPRFNLSIGVTLAYQGSSLGAWRGLMITLLVFTLSIGATFSEGD